MSQETVTTAPDTTKAEGTVNDNAAKEVDPGKIFDGNASVDAKKETVSETKEPEAPKAPDKYELKLMEGSALDPSAVERISTYAKEKGLSQEAAQEILAREDEAVTGFRDNQLQQHMEFRKQWVESIKNDKEFGGEKFSENTAIAQKIIEEYADADLKTALRETGYGDHPALFKFVVKMGQKLKVLNDSYVKASAPSAPKKELHDIFYPSKE